MPDLDFEDLNETDSSDNEESHLKLLSSVSQLDSTQRVKPAQRKEIASEVSEYNLSKGRSNNKNLVNVKELAHVLSKTSKHGVISKKLQKVSAKSKTLCKPLEKPVEERLKRSVGFEKVKKQLRRWDAIVARNSLKDQICFPLNDSSLKVQRSNEFLSQFKNATPLEEEIAKVLKQENQAEEEAENNEFPLTLEEMLEKRKEMAQLRAKLSYKQSKAQRQSKIKSKKYHRLLKREKLRQQLKEFELLQKTDPEAALKKLSELDKTRAQERASLRHRNTGKWAKNLAVKAKYNVDVRKALAEQLKVSSELTQKVAQLDTSDDEQPTGPVENEYPKNTTTFTPGTCNPWVLDVSEEVQEFVSNYKKFWSEKGNEIVENKLNKEEQLINKSDGKNFTLSIENSDTKNITPSIEKSDAKNITLSTEKSETKITSSIKKRDESVKTPEVFKQKVTSAIKSKKKTKKNSESERAYAKRHPTSGVWIVTSVSDECDSKSNTKKNSCDIDTLFDELNDNIMKSAQKKIKKIKKKLRKTKFERETSENKKDLGSEFDLSLKNTHVVERPDMDVGLLENGVENEVSDFVPATCSIADNRTEVTPSIDPSNFIQIKPKRLRTHLPDNIMDETETAVDDGIEQQKIIEEAFGDDDVMADFEEMKKEEEKNNSVVIDTTLPGWGEWGGIGIRPNQRKKRRLVLNIPSRKDKRKKDTIINENENPNLSKHLVKEVPHPFKSVDAFEANIRAPVGREWVPETAHQKLIQKQVVTKIGAVIEPMSENEIVRLKKVSKSPYRGKEKKLNND